MAIEYYKQVKKHHFKADGTPRFKYSIDSKTGRLIPKDPLLLDWETIEVEIPDPVRLVPFVPPVKPVTFSEGLKKVLWTILKGVLFIIAYGTVRGHIHAKKNKR
jgi:hypothetical protein